MRIARVEHDGTGLTDPDLELEVAAVIGRAGTNLTLEPRINGTPLGGPGPRKRGRRRAPILKESKTAGTGE